MEFPLGSERLSTGIYGAKLQNSKKLKIINAIIDMQLN